MQQFSILNYLYVRNSNFNALYIVGKKTRKLITFIFWIFSNSKFYFTENSPKLLSVHNDKLEASSMFNGPAL